MLMFSKWKLERRCRPKKTDPLRSRACATQIALQRELSRESGKIPYLLPMSLLNFSATRRKDCNMRSDKIPEVGRQKDPTEGHLSLQLNITQKKKEKKKETQALVKKSPYN